ncbi:MAG: helix-turn-helix domain-containing protein [Thermoleophilaceae bacterium]|nr:helix-turn-helix domain-containing protein [Thermoleophilaceae bacterium]
MDDGRKSHAKTLVQARTGREPQDVLRELYVDKRHTQQEIADALGIARVTVGEWLREYGITRDDRPAVSLT